MYERITGECRAFYEKSFVIIKESFTRDLNKYAPKIEIRDYSAYVIFKLSKLGYGTIEELKKATSREILQILNYEQFNNDFSKVVNDRIKRDNGS